MNSTPRLYQPGDFEPVLILWRISREISLPDFQRRKGHFFYQDLAFFRDHLLKENTVWVLDGEPGHPAAFMAMRQDFIDHLYVHPAFWRAGYGTALLRFARTLSPAHLWLYTLQINTPACAFYEKNGFTATALGISPLPESEPDVKYEWFGGQPPLSTGEFK
jgi:GNAT superfamily N-acetyltransferase